MLVRCDICGGELFLEANAEDEARGDERCPACGSVGTLRCMHNNKPEGFCEDCGRDFDEMPLDEDELLSIKEDEL